MSKEANKLVSFKDLMQAKMEREQNAGRLPHGPPEETQDTGQPVNQNSVNQLTSEVNQLASQLVNQLASQPDNQLTNENSYRSRRERKLKGLRLPIQKLEKYELWCFMNKVDFQDAVEKAMDWLTSQPVNHVLNDDLDEDKETDEIIVFYRKWTGNKIKPKDRASREEVKRFSDDVCKIGILTAILRAKSKINSLGYCVPVIEEVAESVADLPSDKNTYVKYLQQTVLNVKKGK
jgi:ElaB/YqjD/DUF883 family membrane-anchored ribosome-binding protein